MFSQTLPLYLACATLALAMGLAAPLWTQLFLRLVKQMARVGLWIAASLMALLVFQQLVAMAALEWTTGPSLPASPLTWSIETLGPAPAYSDPAVHPGWWLEELRLLSALLFCLPILHLGLRDQLLRIEARPGLNAWALAGGGLLLTMPLGFLLWGYGHTAAVRSIVSPRRHLESLPPLDQWLWQANSNIVGFGHVWAFKALVPVLGLMLVVLGMLHLMDAGQRLRQQGGDHAGG